MKLGIISDTHNFFDPKIPPLFSGVAHVLHGGDIGQPGILRQLEQLAPVTAVGGNTDDPGWNYPLFQTLNIAGRKILLHHIVDPFALSEAMQQKLVSDKPDVVVFGHSHKPFAERVDGILFLNPGYTGKSRFGMPRTLALLHCSEHELRPEFFPL